MEVIRICPMGRVRWVAYLENDPDNKFSYGNSKGEALGNLIIEHLDIENFGLKIN